MHKSLTEKTRILLLEDEPLFAENITQHLVNAGYHVSGVASNLSGAIEVMKSEGVDLLLADIGLDGPEDGIAAARELRRIRWTPLIYITGRPWKETMERAKNTYPAAFLTKPVRAEDLLAQISLALYNSNEGNLPVVPRRYEACVFVPTVKGYTRLATDDILYILSDSNYARVFLSEDAFTALYPGKAYSFVHVYVSMGNLYSELPSFFYKLSRFEVINLNRIDSIGQGSLFIDGHERVIPERGRNELLNRLNVIRRK